MEKERNKSEAMEWPGWYCQRLRGQRGLCFRACRRQVLVLSLIAGSAFQIAQLPTTASGRNAPRALSYSVGREPAEAGFAYEHRQLEGPLSIHLLRFDPRRHSVILGRALNDGVGRETVSSIARRHGALAAVNGGFFSVGGRYDGDPSGLLKIGDDWYSDAPLARAALGWTRDGSRTLIARAQAGCIVKTAGRDFSLDGLNRHRAGGEAILYTWAFHRSSLTDPSGREIVVAGDGRVQSAGKAGDSGIPPGGFVISLGPLLEDDGWEDLKPGSRARAECRIEPRSGDGGAAWNGLDFVVGGAPVLIEAGEPVTRFEPERVATAFVEERHPRTAVGVLEDGSWVLVVVDGRQSDLSIGMTLPQLAVLMQQLGCRHALNLDGGGSTTFFFEDRVVNSPSDFGVERPVSEAILVMPAEAKEGRNAHGPRNPEEETRNSRTP